MTNELSWCDFIAGWTGGMLGIFVGHPLDTLKVRQQTLPEPTGIIELTRTTYRLEGIPGFFKGLAYPLLGAGIYNALFFGVYGNCLRSLQGMGGENARKMCCENEPPGSNFHRDVFISGCVGGIATVLYACPLDVIKIKLQAQTATATKRASQIGIAEPIYKGPYDAMRAIYKTHGIVNGLYRGLWAMMWRDVPTFGIYTLSYEHILCMFKEKEDRSSRTSILSQVVAGGIAGILSWILVIPLDVIKSRIQADDFGQPVYSGMADCWKKIYHQEGIRAFFLGTILMTVRAFPVNAATFVGYEYTMRTCENLASIVRDSEEKKK
ncbi:UNVERIFIED_CONTAM: hypothetical protein PYX00_007069 [Menopon gallinae]|uniref:Mitochondrial carrier protein n=1 Tax=Menopon gallinae TaxID=328185 RepID=A0AAW2HI24_9NEOP